MKWIFFYATFIIMSINNILSSINYEKNTYQADKKEFQPFYKQVIKNKYAKILLPGSAILLSFQLFLRKKKVAQFSSRFIFCSSSLPSLYLIFNTYHKNRKTDNEEKDNETPEKKNENIFNNLISSSPNEAQKIIPPITPHKLTEIESDNNNQEDFLIRHFDSEKYPARGTQSFPSFLPKKTEKNKTAVIKSIDKIRLFSRRKATGEKGFPSTLGQEILFSKANVLPETLDIIKKFLELDCNREKLQYFNTHLNNDKLDISKKEVNNTVLTSINSFLNPNQPSIPSSKFFYHIDLEALKIQETTLDRNKIYIFSRASYLGKEKIEIIISMNKNLTSIKYIGIIEINNDKKNNDFLNGIVEKPFFEPNAVFFFENFTAHNLKAFMVNRARKNSANKFFEELTKIKEKDIQFLRDIIIFETTKEKNDHFSCLESEFLKENWNIKVGEEEENTNTLTFWLALPTDPEKRKTHYTEE